MSCPSCTSWRPFDDLFACIVKRHRLSKALLLQQQASETTPHVPSQSCCQRLPLQTLQSRWPLPLQVAQDTKSRSCTPMYFSSPNLEDCEAEVFRPDLLLVDNHAHNRKCGRAHCHSSTANNSDRATQRACTSGDRPS